MEKAISRAIEGGWKPEGHREVWQYNPNNRTGITKTCRASLTHNDILLDPLFWQALGKICGFEPKQGRKVGKIRLNSPIGYALDKKVQWWQYTWHRFIDHLASGKDAETFFAELLK